MVFEKEKKKEFIWKKTTSSVHQTPLVVGERPGKEGEDNRGQALEEPVVSLGHLVPVKWSKFSGYLVPEKRPSCL